MISRKIIFSGLVLTILILGWTFRLQLINKLQLYSINAVRADAKLSNADLAAVPEHLAKHQLFSLSGTGRFFPHRVNSLERLRYLYPYFKGFECDVYFDEASGTSYITHDGRIQESATLAQYLAADKNRKILWLDVKNLNNNTLLPFCEELEELERSYGLLQRVIIETPNLDALHSVAKKGYFTSYYLPVSDGAIQDQQTLTRICTVSVTSAPAVISQEMKYKNSIRDICPRKRQLSWDVSFAHSLNQTLLKQYVNDPNILVCLLNIKSPGYQ